MDDSLGLALVQQLSVKPVRSVQKTCNPPMLRVVFQDGSSCQKRYDLKLRKFLTCIQFLHVQRIDELDDCIPQPLGMYELLGYRSGDAISFHSRGQTMAVQFS